MSFAAPPPPHLRLNIGVTGHREDNPTFAANRARIEVALKAVFDQVAAALREQPLILGPPAPPRLHAMLADGVDQLAADQALERRWELVAPLPFGRTLNAAINARPKAEADAQAILAGATIADAEVAARADAILELYERAHLLELADRDDVVSSLFLGQLADSTSLAKAQAYAAELSDRVALAARVMIEQSDLVIGVWDGATQKLIGGTGHTIGVALDLGAPVVLIDARAPEAWRVLRTAESLSAKLPAQTEDERAAALRAVVDGALRPAQPRTAHGAAPHQGLVSLSSERWRPESNRLWHAFRRIEALFSGDPRPFRALKQTYETPDQIGAGSGAGILNAAATLPGADPSFARRIELEVLRRFAWADAVSSYLSDTYRGGMTANFVFSALAIVTGIAYIPFASADEKGYFAAVEFVFLLAIIAITWRGQKQRWHGRWFETRRVAEYLRHAPLLLTLGVARPPGRWPKGAETSWPEWYARHGLRDVGLPHAVVTRAYLRAVLQGLLDEHVVRQRDYHHAKAKRLTTVHRRLDKLSEAMFMAGLAAVAMFLLLTGAAQFAEVAHNVLYPATKFFTFLGVLLPTFGAAIAGIRYFGDFERFAAISEITAEKLDAVHARIKLLLASDDTAIDYAAASELAHAADDIVVSEIENWQAVFGGKHVTVPV